MSSNHHPVCVTRTDDGALKFWATHTPKPSADGSPITLNLNLPKETVVLRICDRCHVTFLAAHSKPSENATLSIIEGGKSDAPKS